MHGNLTVNWAKPRPTRVLAALLTEPGRRMSIDTVVDWVWDDTAQRPKDHKSTIYQYIKQIRHALAQADAPASLTVANGSCSLIVDPSLIDYVAFRTTMTAAREHYNDGYRKRAREDAHAALRLWREEPLADLPTDRAAQWRTSFIRSDWIPANSFLLDQQLADGQPAAVLSMLDDLERKHSLDLSFTKLRMRALNALGRYNESTEYFLRMHSAFRAADDERAAGDLRALNDKLENSHAQETAIVTSGADQQAAAESPINSVRQLPPDVGDFTGHGDTLSTLDSLTGGPAGATRPVVVTLTGPPGVGKTTTAVHWAHHAASRFPHGVLMLDLHGGGQGRRHEVTDVIDTVLSALGYPVDHIIGAAGRAAKLTGLLARRPMLLVLDNVENSAHVQPLLSVLGTCTVVLTSRRRLTALSVRHNVRVVTVAPLSVDESRELLTRRLGPRSIAEPAAVGQLAKLCQGLPLALTIVAERAAGRSGTRLQTLAEQLRDVDTLLTIGDDGDGAGTSLQSAFSVSYLALDETERRTFQLIGLHPGTELTTEVLASAGGVSAPSMRRSLDVLVAAHLVQHPGDLDRYRVHDLLHQYAATLALQAADLDHARRRMLSFYLHSAHNAHLTIYPHKGRPPMTPVEAGCVPMTFDGTDAAWQWCLRERSNLNAATECAALHELHEIGWRLPHIVADIHDQYGFYDDIVTGLTTAASCAAIAGVVDAEAATLNDLGQVHMLIGNDTEADRYLRRAFELVTAHGIDVGRLAVLLNMARRHHHAGRATEAVLLYRECLELARVVAVPDLLAKAEQRLGDALVEVDDLDNGLEHYNHALRMRQELGDVASQISIHTALGALHTQLERFDEAANHCEEALHLAGEARHLPATMKLYTVRAQLAHAQRHDRKALEYAREAVELALRSLHATGLARALATQGQILADRGNTADARKMWTRAASLYRDRERHSKAERVDTLLRDLPADRPTIPSARTGDEDTMAMPAPPRRRNRYSSK
ncbi:tetratricopeptide repeat protein [Amycolatopsis sp. H20-H5]|uniref:tetratricopeptide repeat protein n=1 Tax=Amycolatopsis sp. H20-H5 TaxID=3046309 RepID=UPI002DBB1A1E|nr:tetratricopeptide repeat protein [Amycolatopsis sp. H20-H5]MEC3976374.1 tetratricopeptide repeat protein [Amycolatopsis sp. H20-H5]